MFTPVHKLLTFGPPLYRIGTRQKEVVVKDYLGLTKSEAEGLLDWLENHDQAPAKVVCLADGSYNVQIVSKL